MVWNTESELTAKEVNAEVNEIKPIRIKPSSRLLWVRRFFSYLCVISLFVALVFAVIYQLHSMEEMKARH